MAKRFLITGGAGFIGSHLSDALLKRGDFVTVIDDLSTGRWENVSHLESLPQFRVLVAPTEDNDLIREEVPKHDFVFHLASAVGVQLVVDHPVDILRRTVRGTDVIIENCSRYRKPVLLTSSSEVYGKSEKIPFCEEDDVVLGSSSKRRWAYASAKLQGEFMFLAHFHQNHLPVYIVRLFNTVGPRQSGLFGMVLPRFVEQAKKNEVLRVFGDGKQQRCFCSVFDVVRGLITASESPRAAGKVVNLGNNIEISMYELAQRVIALTGSSSKIEIVPYDIAYGAGFDDMQRRVPSLQRAKELFNWQPSIGLDDIIKGIIT